MAKNSFLEKATFNVEQIITRTVKWRRFQDSWTYQIIQSQQKKRQDLFIIDLSKLR